MPRCMLWLGVGLYVYFSLSAAAHAYEWSLQLKAGG